MNHNNEFPKTVGNDNSPEGREARRAKLLEDQRQRKLFQVFEIFDPLYRDKNLLDNYEFSEWEEFFKNLIEVLDNLLESNIILDDEELKSECKEVLVLLHNQDIVQSGRYLALIVRLSKFFVKNKIFLKSKPI